MYNFHLKFLGAIRSPLSPLPSHLQMQHLQKALFDILPPPKFFFKTVPSNNILILSEQSERFNFSPQVTPPVSNALPRAANLTSPHFPLYCKLSQVSHPSP